MEVKPGYKQTEVGVIPEDWEAKPLDSTAFVTSGKRLPLGRSLTDHETPYPYIRVTDMRPGTISLADIKFVPVDVFPEIRRFRIFKEDIFVSVAGTLGLVGKIPPELDGANLTENADRVTNITCSRDYLLHVLMSPLIQNTIDSLQTVGAQPKLALTRIRKFVIPLPPTKGEQEAIAEALGDADALIESLERLLVKKRQIKQGAMQELLTGKRRLPGSTGEWEVRQVTEFGEIVTGRTPRTDVATFWGEGFPWITPTDISAHRDMFTSERALTEKGLRAIRALPANTVLVTCIASIGKNAILKAAGGCNQQINAVIPSKRNDAEFLYYLFDANAQYLQANAGTTATSIITKTTFKELTFKVPLLAEQTAIAALLGDFDDEIAALEANLAKARQIKQGMMQELLTGRIRLV